MSVLEDLENLFYGRTPPTDVEIQSALRDWKNGVRVATTAAGTLATSFEAGQTVDGVVLVEGDRILIKDQADPIENGIYNVSASGAPSRASDMEATADASGVIVLVSEGTAQADTMWICPDDSVTEIGVNAITFIPFLPSGAGIDTDAIHQSVANEIQSLTAKGTLASTDVFVIEDSAASWAKKYVTAAAVAAAQDYVEFTQRAANPGGTPTNTLYEDDGTNYEAGTLVWSNKAVITGETSIGNPGTEQGSITVAGASYDAHLKVNDIGGAYDATAIIHRHSTTYPGSIAFARTNSDTSAHAVVTNGQTLGQLLFLGHDGTDYALGAGILAQVSGTPGSDDMPTKLVFQVSPDGSQTPATALTIDQDKSVTFAGTTNITGTLNQTGDFAVNTNKFTVDAATGNTLAAGTLSSTGNFAVNTDKATISATDGTISLSGGTVSLNGTTGNFVSPNLNFDGVLDAATGNEVAYNLTPTINKATSGDYTALQVNVTETSAPGTANKLASFGVGGTPVFTLSSAGILATTAAGSSSAPSVAVRDASIGMYSPASNQVGLVANGEAIIVDNDSATPSLRPDVTATWDFGEGSFYWKDGYFEGLYVNNGTAANGIVCAGDLSLNNNGKITLTGALEWLYTANAVAGTTDTLEPVADRGRRFDYQSSSATTVTVNQAASGIQSGAKIELVHSGSGALTFATGTATVRTPPGRDARAAGQYSVIHATYNSNSEVYLEGDLARKVRAAGTSTFSINGADYDAIVNWTGTSTGVAGTVDQGTAGQVTTLVLTGTAGTVTLTAGSGVTLEAEEGKTLTTNAPGASTAVTVSLIYLSATHVVATGGLA